MKFISIQFNSIDLFPIVFNSIHLVSNWFKWSINQSDAGIWMKSISSIYSMYLIIILLLFACSPFRSFGFFLKYFDDWPAEIKQWWIWNDDYLVNRFHFWPSTPLLLAKIWFIWIFPVISNISKNIIQNTLNVSFNDIFSI